MIDLAAQHAIEDVVGTPGGGESVITPYAYQRRMAANKSRFAMYCWSRQTGKSLGCALAINDDVLEVESFGRRTFWTIISRSLNQARELTRKIRDVGRAVLMASNILRGIELVERQDKLGETVLELTYPGGSRVVVVSGNPDAAAGYTGNVWWDEVALTKRAHELFGTAYPVISRGKLRFIMTSTPRPGFWRQRWADAQKPGSVWTTDKLTIHDAIAQGCPMDADELRAGLKDDLKWRQEFLCEDVDDDICWLPWELIVRSADDAASMTPLPCDDPIYAGWDVARYNHLSVLYLLGKRGHRLTTRGVIAMRNKPFDEQLNTIQTTLAKYPNFVRLCIDAGGLGEMPAEQARRRIGRVEAVKFNTDVKAVLAGDLRRVMEEGSLGLPDDDDLRSDLHSVRCTTTAAGNKRFEGEAKESHADRFWACALAVHAAVNTSSVDWTGAGLCKAAPRMHYGGIPAGHGILSRRALL